MVIVERAYARVGLLGNPSDGYFGKTISLSIANFFAEVKLAPSEVIKLSPHPIHDPLEFESFNALADRVQKEGYYGGIRLLMAICSRLRTYCDDHGIHIPHDRKFELSYETNIPRQAGLSGSSAIICAALNCLLKFFDIESNVPKEDRPSLILSAESDLGITAGLQDRVIQVYGGLVFMDFNRGHLERTGNGVYSPMDTALLPSELYVVFASNPSDSGKIHSTVKKRWLAGDTEVVAAMEEIAGLASEGRSALESRDYKKLGRLMDRNFDLRRKVFGDEALGAENLRMVAVPRSVGAAAKFTGSGGAVVALCPEGSEQGRQLVQACRAAGFQCVKVVVAEANV